MLDFAKILVEDQRDLLVADAIDSKLPLTFWRSANWRCQLCRYGAGSSIGHGPQVFRGLTQQQVAGHVYRTRALQIFTVVLKSRHSHVSKVRH